MTNPQVHSVEDNSRTLPEAAVQMSLAVHIVGSMLLELFLSIMQLMRFFKILCLA